MPERCTAITLGGKPDHVLVRCKLDEHETGDHVASWDPAESND